MQGFVAGVDNEHTKIVGSYLKLNGRYPVKLVVSSTTISQQQLEYYTNYFHLCRCWDQNDPDKYLRL